ELNESSTIQFYNKVSQTRKRRKTRTTFSNCQLNELENNFNRQRYLTPTDRDRIAKHLGLTNTQMVVGGSRQKTLDPGFVLLGTRQKGVPVIFKELVIPGGFNLVPPSFTVRDVITELSEPRPTSCRTEMYGIQLQHLKQHILYFYIRKYIYIYIYSMMIM
ncbi:unnamed protein product, partial [Schistosoma mattheei]